MGTVSIRRQVITDSAGAAIAVLLPIEEYERVEALLGERAAADEEAQLAAMREAMSDPGFVADLEETMHAFRVVDSEWWERPA